jgi:hypothetical protein
MSRTCRHISVAVQSRSARRRPENQPRRSDVTATTRATLTVRGVSCDHTR